MLDCTKGTVIVCPCFHGSFTLHMPNFVIFFSIILIGSHDLTLYRRAIKITLSHAMKAEMGSGGIAVLILNLSARWGWAINTMPWPFYPWKGVPLPIVHESGWASGPVWMVVEKRKFLVPIIGVQTPNCPAHSKSFLTVYTLENI